MSAVLELQDVCFAWKDRKVIHGANLSMGKGEALALLGPNGSGKTTLLKLAAGMLQPQSGTILLDGQPLEALQRWQRARKIAMVPQRLQVPFAFTVQQVVEQARTPHTGLLGRLTETDRVAIERALELTDTAQFRHRILRELSGGEQQRVKLALGLAQSPEVLLLDEPAQSLDVGWQRSLLSMIANLAQEGVAILAAVHELHLVAEFFPSSVLLAAGEPLCGGVTQELLESQALHDAFYRAPQGVGRTQAL
ncbi:MAG TPA: ABC transporter ATP-binding protein [Acidobacteriaceae bacterium]|jgi:iron complex transport system ATP-binding protein